MTAIEMSRYAEAIRNCSKPCVCGRYIYLSRHKEYSICDWCGRKVESDKLAFKNRLKKLMKEGI